MIDYANSIVIIGGVGVGKTLVSNRLCFQYIFLKFHLQQYLLEVGLVDQELQPRYAYYG